uniref:Uncharacterized protein n=1 Tax=Triticum urartu TaxID=4572 RepID=A0A8R7TL25_TRIUA
RGRHGGEPGGGGPGRRGAAGVVGAGVPPGARAALDGARGAGPPRHPRPRLALPLRLRPVPLRPPPPCRRAGASGAGRTRSRLATCLLVRSLQLLHLPNTILPCACSSFSSFDTYAPV